MKHTPQRRMKVAHLLTEPKASFVSLVDHGANQVPFSVVKMAGMQSKSTGEEGQAGTPIFNGLEVEAMAGKGDVVIQKITFDQSVFTDEEAVKAYLKKAGIEADIADEGGLFVVKSETDADAESVQVDAEDGVTYSLVKQTEDEAEDTAKSADTDEGTQEETMDVAKSFLNADMTSEETVQRYDAWWASYSEAKDITDVLRAGADGLPIGIYELNDAFYTAFRNSLSDGDYTAARAAVTEFGELAIRLAQALEVATVAGADVERATATKAAIMETPDENTEEAPATETKAADDEPGVTGEGAGEGASEETNEEKAAGTDDAAADASTNDAGADDAAGDTTVVNNTIVKESSNEEIGDVVADMLKKAMAPVVEAVADVSKSVTEGLAEVREQVGKAEERVETLERRSQTRKGADVGDADAPAPDTAAKATPGEDVLRANTLGFRRRVNS